MTEKSRPLRADAARNRARVLQVAYETFAEEGAGVPIDEIARRAGVGAGTVYRHFPTKESLFQAIVADRLRQVVERAREQATTDPGEGLYAFLFQMAEQGATDLGLTEAFAGIGFDLAAALPDAEKEFTGVMTEILAQAQRAGTVRPDLDVADIKTLIVGLQAMRRFRGDSELMRRVYPVIRAGLAAPDSADASPASGTAQTS
ncbi:TetR/AcrR family transcriptional regulator [Planotetraspora kaengkrachanensis]|uniref:TetR family transcriptional regulator n=1 Tax=Planotetraspora kaengkrachanensis TaxID=575193 RepID=A0A8J3VA42_9ACTN|nr:TetR/AcrR family transcriptional regulator [Planotetraspora kaengkrachanensis]GIG83066.1 TetR family transcriptional regulator [Planotetraspora kaengkrachanensis]